MCIYTDGKIVANMNVGHFATCQPGAECLDVIELLMPEFIAQIVVQCHAKRQLNATRDMSFGVF